MRHIHWLQDLHNMFIQAYSINAHAIPTAWHNTTSVMHYNQHTAALLQAGQEVGGMTWRWGVQQGGQRLQPWLAKHPWIVQ